MFKKYGIYILLVLVVIIFLANFFFNRGPEPVEEELAPEEDFYQELKDVSLLLPDLDQRSRLKLTAQRIVEYSSRQESQIFDLSVDLLEDEELRAVFTGERGYLSSTGDRLEVLGPVTLDYNSGRMTCDRLIWEAGDSLVEGIGDIRYEDPRLSITAESFRYQYGEKRIIFEGQAFLQLKEREW